MANEALALIPGAELSPAPWRDKIELIKRTVAKGTTDDQLQLFLYTAQRTGLDPLAKQIHAVTRWNDREKRNDMSIQTGIDGYRLIADRTGKYAGNDDYEFDEYEKQPTWAKARVWKIVEGVRCPFEATARWSQYFPGEKQGFMWKKMPHVMLGKCAEALALRKAFPADLSGVYTYEEMAQAGGAPVENPPQPVTELTGVILEQTTSDDRYWWKIQNGKLCVVFAYESGSSRSTQPCDYSRLIEQEGKKVTLKVYDCGERDGKRLYELADVVKVEPVPNPTTTTQGASPSVPVVEPVPQKIDPVCNIDETLLVCTPNDVVSEMSNKPRYQMVKYEHDQIASCWDSKLWDALKVHAIVGKECVFKVEKNKKGNKSYTNIKGIISIDGVPYKQAVSA